MRCTLNSAGGSPFPIEVGESATMSGCVTLRVEAVLAQPVERELSAEEALLLANMLRRVAKHAIRQRRDR